jgi:ATP-dependent DNA helicase DinG
MEGDNGDIINVELKPLDVGPYCKEVFTKCGKTLMMSATILDAKTFCKSIGISFDDLKVIRVGSDFIFKEQAYATS